MNKSQRSEVDVHPIVRQIIDRDCHVACSYRTVVRHVISRLRNGYESFREMEKGDRRNLIEQCVACHMENRELYRAVMWPSYKPLEGE